MRMSNDTQIQFQILFDKSANDGDDDDDDVGSSKTHTYFSHGRKVKAGPWSATCPTGKYISTNLMFLFHYDILFILNGIRLTDHPLSSSSASSSMSSSGPSVMADDSLDLKLLRRANVYQIKRSDIVKTKYLRHCYLEQNPPSVCWNDLQFNFSKYWDLLPVLLWLSLSFFSVSSSLRTSFVPPDTPPLPHWSAFHPLERQERHYYSIVYQIQFLTFIFTHTNVGFNRQISCCTKIKDTIQDWLFLQRLVLFVSNY